MHAPSQNDLPLVDEAYLQSVQEAVGAAAMVGLVEAMLKDARQTPELLAKARQLNGEMGEAREAHRLGGLFAQFGCPLIAQALKEAAHAAPGEVHSKTESALEHLWPTLSQLSGLYDTESS